MRVLITGAAGFIGSHLSERLVADGADVLGVDCFTPFYPTARKRANLESLVSEPGFVLRPVDLLAPSAGKLYFGVDAVVHLAGHPGVRASAGTPFGQANVATTARVLADAAAAGVRRVLLASSSSVYAPAAVPVNESHPLDPLSPYGRSKAQAERVARELSGALGIELVTLRYYTVYGPRQRPDMAFARFAAAARLGVAVPLFGDGTQVRDFTYVADAVEATVLALEHGRPGAAYNVSGGRPVALNNALELLAEELGRPVPVRPAPRDRREPQMTAADLGAARTELGYEPRIGLEEGLARQAEEMSVAAAA